MFIPRRIKSEVKLYKNIYLKDLVTLVGFFMLGYMTKILVHSYLQLPYTIFVVIVGLILCFPSKTNPGKRIYNSVYYAIKQKNVYNHKWAIFDEEVENEKEIR